MNTISTPVIAMNEKIGARRQVLRHAVIGILMVSAAILSPALRPDKSLSTAQPRLDLAAMIPENISQWRTDPAVVPIQYSPEIQATVEKAYDQTLSRTYIDGRGDRVMLSIAYGSKRHEDMQAHRPETCYPAQGFQIMAERVGELVTSYGTLPIKRLVALQGSRNEPITYWLVVGEDTTRFGIAHRLATLKYGLNGRIPDGMLVRVSTISRDVDSAYKIQDAFVKDLLAAVDSKTRPRLIGKLGT